MKEKIPAFRFLAFAFFCIVTFVCAAGPAKEPDQLIQDLLKAAQKGDVDSFLSGLTEESRRAVQESYANQNSFLQALQEFEKALNEKFGEGEELLMDPPNDLKAAIARLASAEVMTQKTRPDGSIELRVKTSIKMEDGSTISREDPLIARQEGGGWKLWLGFAPDGKIAGEKIEAAQQLTQEVRAGKYKDRVSAMIALANAWSPKGSAK